MEEGLRGKGASDKSKGGATHSKTNMQNVVQQADRKMTAKQKLSKSRRENQTAHLRPQKRHKDDARE